MSSITAAVAQLIMESGDVPSVQPARTPFQVAVLPRTVSGAGLGPATSGVRTVRIPFGVGGDDLARVYLGLPQRAVALVVGAAGTGKSQTLDLIAQVAAPSLRCLRPDTDEDPEVFWKRSDVAGVSSGALLLVDDADLLQRDTHQQLAGMLATGARAVCARAPAPAIATSPALAALPANPLGIVLGSRSPTDGDVFGLHLDVDGTPPPGRGILVDSRGSVEIQVARCEGAVSSSDIRGRTG